MLLLAWGVLHSLPCKVMLVLAPLNAPDGNGALSNKTQLLPVHGVKTQRGSCQPGLRLTAQEGIFLPVPSLRRIKENQIH